MRLLEHEAKQIIKKCGIPVPRGEVVKTVDEITFPPPAMLKTQVPVGGRGIVGGILAAATQQEIRHHFERLLATPVRDYLPTSILVEEMVELEREFFLAITHDTVTKMPVAVFSSQGGVDIEALAREKPEKVVSMHLSPLRRFPSFQARELVARAGVSGRLLIQLGAVFARLADVFFEYDATLAEINP